MESAMNEPSFSASPNTSTAITTKKHESVPGVTIDPRFIYTMKFDGKPVRDLKAEGYYDAIWKYLRAMETEILYYGTHGSGQAIFCVVRARVRVSINGHTIEATALADGHSGEVSDEQLVRHVETRALKRACARVVNIPRIHFNDEEFGEEETGTPITREYSTGRRSIGDAPATAAPRKRGGDDTKFVDYSKGSEESKPPLVASRRRG